DCDLDTGSLTLAFRNGFALVSEDVHLKQYVKTFDYVLVDMAFHCVFTYECGTEAMQQPWRKMCLSP
ncbi:hypothetical protein, partial [Klebsiella pneumoniae]|uniref:hypothetical protein n=1 Tax=Klebsiella pneumoniae TaxID=573 RepID=UPI001C969078